MKMQHTAEGEGHGSSSKTAGSIGNISRGSPCRNNDSLIGPHHQQILAYHVAGLPRGVSASAQRRDVCCPSSAEGLETCVCVCFNSRNDLPRVAQRYGTIAAHTRRHASVRVVCTHVQFCRFDKADATADVQ